MANADIIACTQQLIALLNVGGGASVYNLNVDAGTDGRYSINEIVEAACEADEDVRLAIKQNPDHWAFGLGFTLTDALAHGDAYSTVPERDGERGEVLIQRISGGDFIPARGMRSRAEIERYRANTGTAPDNVYGSLAHDVANSPLSGFYDIAADGTVRFTGYALKFRYGVPSRLLRTVYDGAINSGLKVATSATALFTSADENSLAIIEEARSGAYPLASRIATFTNATTVSLTDAAGATVSGKRLTIARLGSPASYLPAIVRGARGRLWKEGDDQTKAPAFASAFMQDLQAISGAARKLPTEVSAAA